MSVKPAHAPVEEGPITRGKGLDSLVGFLIHNWAPPTRYGIWSKHSCALAAPKAPLLHFLDEALHAAWLAEGCGAVLTIDPPSDPFVTVRVDSENKHWTPEAKYNAKHWLWKVVPVASAQGTLAEALQEAPPSAEAEYLRGLQEGRLKEL